MKKIVVTLLLAAILLTMTPMSATLAEASYATVQSGNQYGVRLRLGPSTSYASQTTLPSGTVVTVLEKGTVWTRIQAGTLTGYMMSKFLVSSDGSNSSSTPSLGTATVYAGNGLRTWLRTAPNGRRLGLYSDGTPLTILGYKGEWTRVMIGSSVGYMMTKYIALPAPTPEPTPIPYSALNKVELNYEYPLVGDTLLATITPSQATVDYQWYRDEVGGTKLSTAAAYTATTADVGHKICLQVTGNGQWAGQKVSVLSQPVTKERKVAGVMIVNTNADHSAPLAGDILKAVVAPSSATVTYSWRVAGVEKGKEATYVVQASDSGKQIQVYATGTGDFSGQAASDMTSKVADALELKEVKLSTSFPVVGQAITATVTPGSATASYVWYVDGIKMGSGASYTPTAFDMGKVITVKATGTDKCAGTVESAASQPVKMVNLTKVSLDSNAPVVGMTLTATAEPAEARTANSVLYYWYVSGEDKPVQSDWSNKLTVKEAYAGKAIYVRAYGQGIYGGVVASAITSPVNSKYTLNGVSLTVTEPVVGDVITAVSDPQNLSKADCLYLWQIGTVTKSSTDNTYTVTSDDVGKQIRVTLKYNGAAVTSAATAKVAKSKLITGIYLYNETTKQNIGSAPQVGQTISVKVNPVSAAESNCVKYSWRIANKEVSTNASYTIASDDAGKELAVFVEATGSYQIKENTSGSHKDKDSGKVYLVARKNVDGGQPINVTLTAAITPKVGQSPVLSLPKNEENKVVWTDGKGNKQDVFYTANITWSPSLSDNGTFRTGESYKAVVNFTILTGGYRLGTVSVKDVNGSSMVSASPVGNTVTLQFSALTATQDVDNFCIYGVTAPEKGKTPVTAIRDCAQYKGTVAWQDEKGNAVTIFEANKVYKAVISLTSAAEYTFPNSGKSLFTVPGAVSAEYNKTGDHTATVTATFNPITTATKAEVYADRDSVTVGTSKKYVVCTALLSGFTGDQDSLTWSWTLANGTADETKIDQNGIVTIDADEKAGLELLVTASTTVEGKAYSASTTIKTATDDSTGDLSPVVTIVKSVSELQAGKETTFIATVQNSNNETVRWSVEGVDGTKSSGTTIGSSTGILKISKFETVKQLKVTATAVPTGETAVCYVTVVYAEAPISITFVEGQKSVSIGQSATFKVAISAAEANPKAEFAVAANNGKADVTFTATDDTCTVTVPGEPSLVGKEIFVTARYACKDEDGNTHEVSAKYSFIITETAPEAKAATMTLEGAALLPDDDFAVADDEPAAQPEEAATAPAKGIDTKSDSISLVISGGEEEPAAKDEESKEAPETEEKPAEEPKAEEKPAEPAVRKTEINTKNENIKLVISGGEEETAQPEEIQQAEQPEETQKDEQSAEPAAEEKKTEIDTKNENIKLVISGGDEEPVQTEKTKDEAPAEAETEKETVVVNEKEKKDAKEQKPDKKEEAPAEIGVTVYGPDVAKVVPGKVYTFSAEVSCAVEGYDIVWSVYCSDETVKASIVDGELYVTENPTGEDQVLRIRARYKDADGNLYSEGSYASFHVTVAPGIAKPRVIKESKPAEKESENGKAAEAEGNKEPAKVEESKETVKPETTEPKKIYEDDRDDPDYVPFD